MIKKVLVAIADGIEEIETMSIVDTLRRAGAELTIASVQGKRVSAAHGVVIEADKLIQDCTTEEFDLVVLPGGMPGATNLKDSEDLKNILTKQNQKGLQYAAICASPAVVLKTHGLLEGKRATCYPSYSNDLGDRYCNSSVVVTDDNCTTSQGPGTALVFALKLVELLYGIEKAKGLKAEMLVG